MAKEKSKHTSSIRGKLFLFILIVVMLFAIHKHFNSNQRNEAEENTTSQAEIVDKNLSDDEYISLLKDLKPSGSTLTVDELFRKNYGIPQYKFTTENGEKYVLTRANSYAVCETLTFYFKITEYTNNTAFQPIKCIITDQVQMRDTELNQKNTENLLKTIFKN